MPTYDTARGTAPVKRGWDSYDTDQYRTVRLSPQPAPDETDHGAGKHRPDEPPSPWWAGTGANAATAAVLALLAAVTAGLYWLACELTGHPAPWRVLLIVLATVLGVGAVGAILHGWTQRVLTAKVDRAVTAVDRAVAAAVTTLEETSGRKAAILEQIAARMGRVEGVVADELATLRRRVEAAEEKADAANEAAEFARQRSWWLGYAQGARDQLGGGTNGNVVRLPTS